MPTTYATLNTEGRACVDHTLATLADTVARFLAYTMTPGEATTAAAQDALAALMTDTTPAAATPYDSAQAFDAATPYDGA